VAVTAIAAGGILVLATVLLEAPAITIKAPENNADQDTQLQAIAASALGTREGTVIVLDPQSGRVRAVVNPSLAFQSAFPPGSTIKPFTTLAALRSGIITRDTLMRCRGKHKSEDVVDACSHPPHLDPFNPADAIAYSCNYYFATVGERLHEGDFARVLSDFGFGHATGIDAEEESTGVLARGRWQAESAIGEGPFLQVTPVQMAMAYAALFNGGRLLKPTHGFTTEVRGQVRIDDDERKILLGGMRGAVTYGTAQKADLAFLSQYVVGKTGTSTQLQGFRSQGWFVGLVFQNDKQVGPGDAQLLVVVFMKNSHGTEAAEVARPIFAEFGGPSSPANETTYVSVHQVSENSTERISLDDYILHVVATEASVEDQPEALKALAIAARTYALKNLGRHQKQGYDFCSTTHCLRFESVMPQPSLVAAVKDTSDLVLRDEKDQIIDAYFSASCGGTTANLKTLWGEEAPPYLRGVRDDYCNSGPHYRWTDVIDSQRLARALRSDPRTDVGQRIRELSVVNYDQTGRAELVSIAGDRRHTISGWEFKLIVGRTLGWNVLKSSRFNVSRSGSGFVFRGGGFGHGLGLCQEGSHVMAQRGQSYRQILAHYFPGTSVREYRSGVATRSSSHFRVVYPQTLDQQDAEQVLSLLEANRAELLSRVSAAGIQPRFPNLEIVINETTGDFVGRTGMPPWAGAATKNRTVELQPVKLLKQRRILETTLRHELVHVLIDAVGGAQTPRWLTEGLALYFAGEGKAIEREQPLNRMSPETVEQSLILARSATEMRIAYAAAYNLVKKLIQAEGEDKVWKRLADRRYSVLREA